MREISILFAVGVSMVSIGCREKACSLDQNWLPRVKITETRDSLGGGISLREYRGKVFALQPQGRGVTKFFLLNSNSNSWVEVQLTGVPDGYYRSWPIFGGESDRVAFKQDYVEGDQLVVSVLIGRLTIDGEVSVRDTIEKRWITKTKELFGETSADIRLTEQPERRDWPALGMSFMFSGSELDLPYSLCGFTFGEKGVAIARGPYVNGVLHSSDLGEKWIIENISESQSWHPSISKTEGHYYYFAVGLPSKPSRSDEGNELRFAQKPIQGKSWTSPQAVTKTFGGAYVVESQADTVHLCWKDRRHGKRKLVFSLFPLGVGSVIHNDQITYCNRKDADLKWNQEIFLSKGLANSFSPSISVEGDEVVVVWAGIEKADSWHDEYDPNDIYYVTSKDDGKTWTKPLRITDGGKDGLTSGDPEVVLLNGVIHLTYIQGKMNLQQESPGLTKLNQPPWPIYYTQRPFPK